MRVAAIALLVLLVPVQGALASAPPRPKAAAWIVEAPGHGGLLVAHAADRHREIASLTKLMTAHLVLRYVPMSFVAVTGPDATAVGESSVPLAVGEPQTAKALLAALIVHSGNDAAIVLAHATMDQPEAQAAAIKAARALHRPLPGDPVARFVLLMNAEARRLGLRGTTYRTPHGLDEPGAHSSAHDVLTLAQLDMASPIFRQYARRQAITIPGHPNLPSSNTLLAAYAGLDGVKTGHTDQAGWNLAASAERGGVRLYVILLGAPDEPSRDRDVARLLDWGFGRFQPASLVRAGEAFGHSGQIRVVAARGLSAMLDPGEQVRERVVLPRRLNSAVVRGERVGYVELRSSARGLLGRVPLVADRAGGGRPALVTWLRSRHLPFSLP
ncbi:MAG TPA: D-alanyl-D-alanine carboxypeptidase family protein [Gaiellales bacterium]|nr:D-alanyl-D-alanine carboxypeptidase family protein [Gaiellales bacterium]